MYFQSAKEQRKQARQHDNNSRPKDGEAWKRAKLTHSRPTDSISTAPKQTHKQQAGRTGTARRTAGTEAGNISRTASGGRGNGKRGSEGGRKGEAGKAGREEQREIFARLHQRATDGRTARKPAIGDRQRRGKARRNLQAFKQNSRKARHRRPRPASDERTTCNIFMHCGRACASQTGAGVYICQNPKNSNSERSSSPLSCPKKSYPHSPNPFPLNVSRHLSEQNLDT